MIEMKRNISTNIKKIMWDIISFCNFLNSPFTERLFGSITVIGHKRFTVFSH